MSELDLWRAFLDRDDVQALDPVDRMALISVAVQVATDEPDDDGLLTRGSVRRVPWHAGPGDLTSRLDGVLADNGFVKRLEGGWQLIGWTERADQFKSGQVDFEPVRWGQQPSAKRKLDRARSRRSSSTYRQRQRNEDAPSASSMVTDHANHHELHFDTQPRQGNAQGNE